MEWNDPVPEDIRSQWEKLRHELSLLGCLKAPRYYKSDGIGELSTVEMHLFSDACLLGYGQCSYLRLLDNQGNVSCSLVMAKSRVVPVKPITIPRLELMAAFTSVLDSEFLNKELKYDGLSHFFWSESKFVLGYIANMSTRFHIVVANRVQKIQDHTQPSQCRYIESKKNPADISSRGSSADALIHKSIWWNGPVLLSTVQIQSSISKPFMLDNDWHRLKRA
ncbi:uncharacterized protein LOC102809679 [Saccoglossus kowalevskii]|uniref:Uncharacterized protein LOC102809679 n=1 Tax=Saccoglossus kowalevskii TaxID=10224 RepID=A0ABM0M5T0_SACKO|nr:PREDICTED: uncharacterized protein LOC102809679 [Saccoglossus kowalevskii]